MDKKILIGYWKTIFKDLPYEDRVVLPYSEDTRNEIINTILDKNYSVMIRPMSKENGWEADGIMIWIDKGRFGQS